MRSSNTSRALFRGDSRRRRPLIVVATILFVLAALTAAAAVFIALFDWNRARPAAQDLISRLLEREIVIEALDVDWRVSSPLVPLIRVDGLRIGNPSWTQERTMATAGRIEFPVTPGMVWDGLRKRPIEVPYLRLDAASADLQRDDQGRANWWFGPETGRKEQQEPSRLQVQRLRIGASTLRFRDALLDVDGRVRFETRQDAQWPTHAEGNGTWLGAPFSFIADSGPLLSLRRAGEEFPMRVSMRAGNTRIDANGTIADIAREARIDTQLDIAGPSLAALYPTVKLALPSTPPYRLSGRFTKQGDRYTFDGFSGTIGRSDLSGSGSFEDREPRPMLIARLESRMLDLADLGPAIGVRPVSADARAEARAREPAQRRTATPAAPARRVLPNANFSIERFNALDADVTLRAHDLRLPEQAPLSDFATAIKLQAGVLLLEPVTFGFAGGEIVGVVRIDGTQRPMETTAAVDFRRVHLGKLIPAVEGKAGSGLVGARVRLRGRGESVAAMLGTSSGAVTLGMAGGTVSQLATAAASLNGGKLLASLLGGDKPTPIRCAGVALDVQSGVGQVSHFVFDTQDVRFTAEGSVNLAREQLALTLRSQPKKPSLFSVRAPVHVSGTFSAPQFGVDARALARGGAALALGALNPFAALLPLIETGPGEDSDCRNVLAPVSGAAREAKNPSEAPARPPATAAEARKEASRAGGKKEAPKK